jgi:hypothetical protein
MNSMSCNFTAAETWQGGHYEIEFELGAPSDERLRLALQRIWSYPALKGCCFSRDQEPQSQVRVIPGQHTLEGHLYGVANLPSRATAACGTYVCRLQGEDGELSCDLLALYIPLGSLTATYGTGGLPFSDADRAATWRSQVDSWLVELGRFVFEEVKFSLALVGWEVDFPRVSTELVRRDGIPKERCDGYLWRAGDQLEWYPPTKLEIVGSVKNGKTSGSEAG